MNQDLLIVVGLLGAAVVMFARNRPRMDAVALIMMTALPISSVIGIEEALAGFSGPNIVLIAALFVIGGSLLRTGIAQRLGDWLVKRAGHSEARLIALLMAVVAGEHAGGRSGQLQVRRFRARRRAVRAGRPGRERRAGAVAAAALSRAASRALKTAHDNATAAPRRGARGLTQAGERD